MSLRTRRLLKKLKRKLFFAAWCVFWTLLLVEVGARFLLPSPRFEAIVITHPDGAQYSLSRNPRLIYEPKPGTGPFNLDGYRGKLYPHERQPGKKRIVFIGDSVTEGLGVEVGERFTDLLEGRLEDTEVINLGVRGYNFVQEVEYLKEKGLAYSPDVVTFGVTYNDLYLHGGEITAIHNRLSAMREGSIYAQYYAWRGRFESFLFGFQTYRYYKFLVGYFKQLDFYNSANYLTTAEEAKRLAEEVLSIAKAKGFKISFAFLPVDIDRTKMDLMLHEVKSLGLPFLDLDSEYRDWSQESKRSLFLPKDPCHLNAEGHRDVTDRMLSARELLF